MIDMFREISDACALGIPEKHHKVVGVIGAGGIVAGAHLPAYRKAGLSVHAITDIDKDKAASVAKDFDIPHVYATAEELLADPSIEVVDIAVPASEQPALLMAALDAGNTCSLRNLWPRRSRLQKRWLLKPVPLVSRLASINSFGSMKAWPQPTSWSRKGG